ncbi:MAG: hypothetical protein R3D30_01695 [Hyphomicrobiales bacterium]
MARASAKHAGTVRRAMRHFSAPGRAFAWVRLASRSSRPEAGSATSEPPLRASDQHAYLALK